jgi:predicted Zn-dependent peptidase
MNTKIFDPYDFSKKEINGVQIYYKNLPWAPCIHVRVVFNTSAFDDPVGKEGLSHFL